MAADKATQEKEIAVSYDPSITAVLLVDPYNDFLSEGGKLWPRVKAVAEEVKLLDHLHRVVASARAKGIKIFFVPHHRFEAGDLSDWVHPTPYQKASAERLVFGKDTWGGTFHDGFQPQKGDIVAHEHWGSSGFANTDLDLQLKQHGIQQIVLIGMIANTCIEATGRFGMELGYHTTLLKDATAAFSREAMQAAHDINGPTYAHAILSTDELLARLSA
jgi:nicotinamidase-related amidase